MKLDLIVVAADPVMSKMVTKLLEVRTIALNIRDITFEVVTDQHNDPGVFSDPCRLLTGFEGKARHAIALLDCAWDGTPGKAQIESKIAQDFDKQFKDGWARAIAIEPELEVWVFAKEAHLKNAINWTDAETSPRQWLESQGEWASDDPKPHDPKSALQKLCTKQRIPFAGRIHTHIAQHSGFADCVDSSFLRLRSLLQEWFPKL